VTNIDQKIKTSLKKLHEAHIESEKYYAKQVVLGEPTKPHDIYNMALAFDTEKKIYLELNLARSEKFLGRFSAEEVESIKKEIEELSFNIKAWRNRKFPIQYASENL